MNWLQWSGSFMERAGPSLETLILLMMVDYLTGVIVAVVQKRLSSAIGYRGIMRKVLILILVGVAMMMDERLLHHQGALQTAIVSFYAANEGISILENCVRLGLPIPKRLRNILLQLRDKGD